MIDRAGNSLMLALLVTLFAAMTGSAALAAADELSVEQFLKQKDQWPIWMRDNKVFSVEGRPTTVSAKFLKFQNCEVSFRPQRSDRFEVPDDKTKNIEVRGRLVSDNREIFFMVGRLSAKPSDAQMFDIRAKQIPEGNSARWFELGAWAAARAAFYKDDSLQKQAQQAERRGVDEERKKLAGLDDAKTAEGLLALADRIQSLKLSPALGEEFVHEALRLKWKQVNADPGLKVKPLTDEIRKRLPSAGAPLETWPEDLAASYERDPLATYRAADADRRKVLHRVLLVSIVVADLEQTAKPDGSNGAAISSRLADVAPERKDLIESYRAKELESLAARVATMTRQEAIQLADKFREQGDNTRYRSLIRTWLDTQVEAKRKDGPAGLVPLADEYVRLLNDRPQAARLYIEAYDANHSPEVAEKLREIGYALSGDQWLSPDEQGDAPKDPLADAMRQGLVKKGMSREQVQQTLGGPPTHILRQAAANETSETWVYSELAGGGLTVHFVRIKRANEPAKVVAVKPYRR